MFVHVFGAGFGLALSFIHSNKRNWKDNPNIKGTYSTTTYSFFGTLFLWILFPAYNWLFVQDHLRLVSLFNVLLALCSWWVTSIGMSYLYNGGKLST